MLKKYKYTNLNSKAQQGTEYTLWITVIILIVICVILCIYDLQSLLVSLASPEEAQSKHLQPRQ